MQLWKLNSSVESAYYFIMNNLVDNGKLMVEDICKKIWSLKILQKIKAFHSRAARGYYFRLP
jgi:hypothetical protein